MCSGAHPMDSAAAAGGTIKLSKTAMRRGSALFVDGNRVVEIFIQPGSRVRFGRTNLMLEVRYRGGA